MIRIFGQSDDLMELEGDVSDEFEPGFVCIGSGSQCLRVDLDYGKTGWEFKLSQPYVEDDDGAVPWPVRVEQAHGYSLAVVVDCPGRRSRSTTSPPTTCARRRSRSCRPRSGRRSGSPRDPAPSRLPPHGPGPGPPPCAASARPCSSASRTGAATAPAGRRG